MDLDRPRFTATVFWDEESREYQRDPTAEAETANIPVQNAVRQCSQFQSGIGNGTMCSEIICRIKIPLELEGDLFCWFDPNIVFCYIWHLVLR